VRKDEPYLRAVRARTMPDYFTAAPMPAF
jgi:hypothetical protein